MKMKTDLSKYAGKKVAVAMSGGVDSSVCALMLKNAGADVFGISMKTVPNSTCCKIEDLMEAKEICDSLGIPHYMIDLRELFEKEAIDYFVDESLKGRNPNPCVPCNQKVKFGALVKEAEKLGAEFFATGHYAIIELIDEEPILKRSIDVKKDQSYVLSMLKRDVLKKLIFPMGYYTKDETRKIAEDAGLKVHSKSETQDLCFLDKEKGEFIEHWSKKAGVVGNIVDKEHNVLGKHKGIIHYTIGQRQGLGLKNQDRLYVNHVKSKENEIVVGGKEELYCTYFYVDNLNWASIDKLKEPMDVEVLVRNKTDPKKCKIIPEGNRVKIETVEPIWAISPGQIAVFIKGDVVLGGGWIC